MSEHDTHPFMPYRAWEKVFLSAHLGVVDQVVCKRNPPEFSYLHQQLIIIGKMLDRLVPQELEGLFRLMESQIYFIATPIDEFPGEKAVLPQTGSKSYDYSLGVVVGTEAAQRAYQDLGVTYEQNLASLNKTGLRIPTQFNEIANLPFCN